MTVGEIALLVLGVIGFGGFMAFLLWLDGAPE